MILNYIQREHTVAALEGLFEIDLLVARTERLPLFILHRRYDLLHLLVSFP